MKYSYTFICMIILTALTVTACGTLFDSGMSDEEFTEEALYACNELQEDLESVQNLEEESEAFSDAAEMMMEFELDPETAPQAATLRDSLVALADAGLAFDAALKQAAEENGWSAYTWMIMSADSVLGYSEEEGIFGITPMDIDEAVVAEYLDEWDAVSEAAEALGLEGCQINADSDSE